MPGRAARARSAVTSRERGRSAAENRPVDRASTCGTLGGNRRTGHCGLGAANWPDPRHGAFTALDLNAADEESLHGDRRRPARATDPRTFREVRAAPLDVPLPTGRSQSRSGRGRVQRLRRRRRWPPGTGEWRIDAVAVDGQRRRWMRWIGGQHARCGSERHGAGAGAGGTRRQAHGRSS